MAQYDTIQYVTGPYALYTPTEGIRTIDGRGPRCEMLEPTRGLVGLRGRRAGGVGQGCDGGQARLGTQVVSLPIRFQHNSGRAWLVGRGSRFLVFGTGAVSISLIVPKGYWNYARLASVLTEPDGIGALAGQWTADSQLECRTETRETRPLTCGPVRCLAPPLVTLKVMMMLNCVVARHGTATQGLNLNNKQHG